jgi:hypothetical protein
LPGGGKWSGINKAIAKSGRAHVSWSRSPLSVILNDVKDQVAARNVYAMSYSRRLILHFVQDDK